MKNVFYLLFVIVLSMLLYSKCFSITNNTFFSIVIDGEEVFADDLEISAWSSDKENECAKIRSILKPESKDVGVKFYVNLYKKDNGISEDDIKGLVGKKIRFTDSCKKSTKEDWLAELEIRISGHSRYKTNASLNANEEDFLSIVQAELVETKSVGFKKYEDFYKIEGSVQPLMRMVIKIL